MVKVFEKKSAGFHTSLVQDFTIEYEKNHLNFF